MRFKEKSIVVKIKSKVINNKKIYIVKNMKEKANKYFVF